MRKVRIDAGAVREVLDSGDREFPPFAPEIVWVECADTNVVEGWTYDGAQFNAPPPPVIPIPIPDPISILTQQVADLTAALVAANVVTPENISAAAVQIGADQQVKS